MSKTADVTAADVLALYEEVKQIRSKLVVSFDARGNLLKIKDPLSFLFDEDGTGMATQAARSAVREYIMDQACMPGAHTDMACLFYSIMAQEVYNVPARRMFSGL